VRAFPGKNKNMEVSQLKKELSYLPLKQVAVAHMLGIDKFNFSKYINGHLPMPEKHRIKLAQIIAKYKKLQ